MSRPPPASLLHAHNYLSSERYWIAAEWSSEVKLSDPARSATVGGTTVRQRDFPQNASLSAANRVAPSETTYNDGTNNFIMVNPPIGNWSCR